MQKITEIKKAEYFSEDLSFLKPISSVLWRCYQIPTVLYQKYVYVLE